MEKKEHHALIPYIMLKALGSFQNVYEVRLFGWILARAQSATRNFDKNLMRINVQHALRLVRLTIPARYLLPPNDHSYSNISKAFTLANKTIEYEHEGILYHLNIIAFPELQKNGRERMFTCVIHNALWYALLDFTKGYRRVSLSAFLTLKSTPAMILYIIISQQEDSKYYNFSELRELLGAHGESYRLINNFTRRYLMPAKRELDTKAPYTCEFEFKRGGGKGSGTQVIKIIPKVNGNYTEVQSGLVDEINAQRLRLDSDVRFYLTEKFRLTMDEITNIEPLVYSLGGKGAQLDKLSRIFETARRYCVKKYYAYLKQALCSA